jgi:hypothetical protein
MSRCFIVGGGPTLIGFNFNKLNHQEVIAVNQAIFNLPNSKYFITMDYTFFLKTGLQGKNVRHDNRSCFINSQAVKYFVIGFKPPRLTKVNDKCFIDNDFGLKYNLNMIDKVIESSTYGGIGTSFSDFRCGSESGYSAIQLAIILGYTDIYLLGFDFTVVKNKTHYHNAYPRENENQYMKKLEEFLTPYPKMADQVKQMGISIYSCSEISRLNQYFKFVKLEDVL